MKENLTIFNYSHSMLETEILSLFGHKYLHAFPFNLKLTLSMENADIIMWDGVCTLKNKRVIERMLNLASKDKFLIILGETQVTHSPLFNDYPEVRKVDISGRVLLPEEILQVIEETYQKLKHDQSH